MNAVMYTPASLAERIKQEIREDLEEGVLPDNIECFSDLHDYVDPNVYGLGSDDRLDIEVICKAQGIVDKWLKEGGHRE